MTDQKSGARKLPDEALAAPIGTIPLPPDVLIDELDNSGGAPQAGRAAAAEVATLDFVDGPPAKRITLRYPFRLDGRVVDAVTVRPLTVEETSKVIESMVDGRIPDNVDFYSIMTGLPAAVIRALPGADGEEVTTTGYNFLPRFMKGDGSPPILGNGDA